MAYWLLAHGYQLFVAVCLLLTLGYALFAIRDWLFAIGEWLFASGYSLLMIG